MADKVDDVPSYNKKFSGSEGKQVVSDPHQPPDHAASVGVKEGSCQALPTSARVKDASSQTLIRVKEASSQTLPTLETLEAHTQVQALVLTPYAKLHGVQFPSENRSVTTVVKLISSVKEYWMEVKNMGRTSHQGMTTKWLIHLLLTDKEGQPVIGGYKVTESILYSDIPSGTTVFQLSRQVDSLQAKTCPEIPACKSLSGVEVSHYLIPSELAWSELHDCLAEVLQKVAILAAPTPDDLAQQLKVCCPRLKHLQVTGAPSGIKSESRRVTSTTVPQYLEAAEIPTLPEQQISSDCEQQMSFNMAVGFFIQNYDKPSLPERQNCQKDLQCSREISELMGCHPRDIHFLFGNGRVVKYNLDEFFAMFLQKCQRKRAAKHCIVITLIVSAHGCSRGLFTSDGKIVKLNDVVTALREVATHVTVIYQPCRGGRHLLEGGFMPEGFSFPNDETSGCSLPPQLPGCCALFASLPGYVSYRDASRGSFFLLAVRNALRCLPRPERTLCSVETIRRLAEAAQAEFRRLHHEGQFWCEDLMCAVQFHYSVQGDY